MREISDPRPGWFKVKRVKGGPWLPARIDQDCHCTINGPDVHAWEESCDRYPRLQATIDGQPVGVYRVWTSGREITKAHHDYIVQSLAYDRARGDRSARPDQPIDLDTINVERFRP